MNGYPNNSGNVPADARQGLSTAEIERSRAEHGSNRLVEIRSKSWWELLRESLGDRTLKILMGAAVAVFITDLFGPGFSFDGVAILVAVAAAATVSAYNDWRAQAEFKSLQVEREAFRVRVVRETPHARLADS